MSRFWSSGVCLFIVRLLGFRGLGPDAQGLGLKPGFRVLNIRVLNSREFD